MQKDDLACGKKITSREWVDGALRERGLDDQPFRLYKYLSPMGDAFERTLEDAFVESRVYLSSTTVFNDPFDAQVDIASLPRRDLQVLVRKGMQALGRNPNRNERRQVTRDPHRILKDVRESIAHQIKVIGIHCVTERWNNLLMWSHYAYGHKGVALVYRRRTDEEFFLAVPVRYRPTYPVLSTPVDIQDNIAYHTVLRKADIWSYEREWRFIKPQAAGDYLTVRPDIFHGVIFGLNADEKTKSRIATWTLARQSRGLPPIALYQAVRAKGFYGVELTRLSDGARVADPDC